MDLIHIKQVRQALNKARAKEIKISRGHYPMCPRCGSWEIERRHRSGEIWPMCRQRLKDLKAEPWKGILPKRWREDILKRFTSKE